MTALKAQLKTDRIQAMRDRNEQAKNALGMALTAIQKAEAEGVLHELDDAQVLAILKKEVSSREDSAEAYATGNRQDLVDKELAEAAILQRYLPTPLTEAEVDQIVADEVAKKTAELGEAPTIRQMGLIIKAVNELANGRADGAMVAAKVKVSLGLTP